MADTGCGERRTTLKSTFCRPRPWRSSLLALLVPAVSDSSSTILAFHTCVLETSPCNSRSTRVCSSWEPLSMRARRPMVVAGLGWRLGALPSCQRGQQQFGSDRAAAAPAVWLQAAVGAGIMAQEEGDRARCVESLPNHIIPLFMQVLGELNFSSGWALCDGAFGIRACRATLLRCVARWLLWLTQLQKDERHECDYTCTSKYYYGQPSLLVFSRQMNSVHQQSMSYVV